MTLQDLRYLVALADSHHFGRAAEACHVSQPALSTQIKKLEDELGTTLFERTNRSVRVTPVGEEIVKRARGVLSEVGAIADIARSLAGPLAGVFKLGVIPTLGPYLLPWFVPALQRTYAELRLAVQEDVTDVLLERLVAHRLDGALVALPISEGGLEVLPIFDEPFFLAEPRGRKAAAHRVVRQDELRGRRLLLLADGHCLRDQALAVCGATGRDADADFSATSLETIREMVATGMGATLLPALACGDARAKGVALRPLEEGVGRRIGLVWRKTSPRARDVRLLAQTLRDHLPAGIQVVDPSDNPDQSFV